MKLLFLGFLGFMAYKVFFPPQKEVFIDKNNQITELDDGEYSDYEEIE